MITTINPIFSKLFIFPLLIVQHAHSLHLRCSKHLVDVENAHLLLCNLQEFDIPYLHALLKGDSGWYLQVENYAKSLGIGPLAPCMFAASPNEQKTHCRKLFYCCHIQKALILSIAYWHHDANNKLCHSPLLVSPQNEKCAMTYDIFVTADLHDCSYVLILSTNPHNHPLPLPVKTLPQIVNCLASLLLELDWKLADATPWRLALDSGFILGLCHALGWYYGECDPLPHDLHPSLGNLDHLHRLINTLQNSYFPDGTGFQGMMCLELFFCYLTLCYRRRNTLARTTISSA